MANLKYINQYSKDPKKLIEFYEEVIGLVADEPNGDWYSFKSSGVQFAVEPESNRANNVKKYSANWGNAYLIQIGVSSMGEMREIVAKAKVANATVLLEFKPETFGTLTKLLDPDGNMVELIYDS